MKNAHAQALGRKGGQSKSPEKIAAILKNLKKARKKRWNGASKKTA